MFQRTDRGHFVKIEKYYFHNRLRIKKTVFEVNNKKRKRYGKQIKLLAGKYHKYKKKLPCVKSKEKISMDSNEKKIRKNQENTKETKKEISKNMLKAASLIDIKENECRNKYLNARKLKAFLSLLPKIKPPSDIQPSDLQLTDCSIPKSNPSQINGITDLNTKSLSNHNSEEAAIVSNSLDNSMSNKNETSTKCVVKQSNSKVYSNSPGVRDDYVPVEEFFDAQSDFIKITPLCSRCQNAIVNTYKFKYNGVIFENNQMLNISKISDRFEEQYIEKKNKNGQNVYSGYLRIKDKTSVLTLEVIGDRKLLIADSDKFIARIQIFSDIDMNKGKAFKKYKTLFLDNIIITKVLEDELLNKRNDIYNSFKQILEMRSNKISDDLECAEDFFQISKITQNSELLLEPIDLFQWITNNKFISSEINTITKKLRVIETSILARNKCFPRFSEVQGLSPHDLSDFMKKIFKKGVKNHKQNLLNNCPSQNFQLLCKVLNISSLPMVKILLINRNDIKLFSDLMALSNDQSQVSIAKFLFEFIDNLLEKYFKKVESDSRESLIEASPLTNPIYYFLMKSFRDIIFDINKELNIAPHEFFVNYDFSSRNIKCNPSSSLNESLKKQLNLIFQLMKHFEPGSCSRKKFCYKFELLGDDGKIQIIINFFKKMLNGKDIFENMAEERLIWLYFVDAGVAPILSKKSDNQFKKLADSLLKGFIRFIKEAQHDRYETFRLAAHNIVRFALKIAPYFTTTTSDTQIDFNILEKQIEYIKDIFGIEDEKLVANHFTSLMDVYNEYWNNREKILRELPTKYSMFKADIDSVTLSLLGIVETTLSKTVAIELVICFFRHYNEFLNHLKAIDFKWLISSPSHRQFSFNIDGILEKIVKGNIVSYKVLEAEKFIENLNDARDPIPKHFSFETIKKFLEIISMSLNKSNWCEADCVRAESDLFLAISHSFSHFEDQVDYNDIEHFLRDFTSPFQSVVENSETYSHFKTRLENVENFYLYSRKQNQIGIETALNLCEKEVNDARRNEFVTSFDKNILETCYYEYSKKIFSLKSLEAPEILDGLKDEMKNVYKQPLEQWTPQFKQSILPILLAYLSSIWTIQESKDVAVINKSIEPHCVQILCIFRLLGVDYPKNGVPKHFAQVLTGQGKSIILCLLSSLIALTGHKCDIVCYSKYLATRDQNANEPFFKVFNQFSIESKINYITFDNMAENFVTRKINDVNVSLRSVVNKIILDKPCTHTIASIEDPKDTVLAIDEADVFFSDDFYPETYNPCSNVGMQALVEIQPKLWEIVNGGIYEKRIISEKIRDFINKLLKEEKHKDFQKFVSTTTVFFEEHLEKMIDTAITVSKGKKNDWFMQQYKINHKGVICFRDRLGCYDSETYIGYYNAFNYFRLKKDNYDDKGLNNYGYFFIIWGYISYANLPLAFKNIIGVSGTLMNLNNSEISAMKKYGIQTMTAMPSFFGTRNLKFTPSEHVSFHDSDEIWHSKIYNRISDLVLKGRALLVFFKTDVEVKTFEEKYRNQIDRLFTLTGDEEPSSLEWRVNEAGVAQTVTLATRNMGRGIDYKSNDISVEDLGGIHVIQTFFSLDVKEETQLKGRTARQNNSGSYEMILCREHLKKIDCSTTSNGELVKNYEELCTIRRMLSSKREKVDAKIKISVNEHNLTMKFLESLTKYKSRDRLKYLSQYPFVNHK